MQKTIVSTNIKELDDKVNEEVKALKSKGSKKIFSQSDTFVLNNIVYHKTTIISED